MSSFVPFVLTFVTSVLKLFLSGNPSSEIHLRFILL